MLGAKLLGGLFLLLGGYYGQFYAWRHEPVTLAQAMALLIAAALLLLQQRPAVAPVVWFRDGRPVAWPGWLALGALLGAAVAVFAAMDAGSHSASDTLHRIVPTYSLLAALVVKLLAERSARAGGTAETGAGPDLHPSANV